MSFFKNVSSVFTGKNSCISGPVQFATVLFKGHLYGWQIRGTDPWERAGEGEEWNRPVSHTEMRRSCGGASIVKDKGVQRSSGYFEMNVLTGIPGERVPRHPGSAVGWRGSWGGEGFLPKEDFSEMKTSEI